MPKRIQRKRTKGWRMPENAVYVGRPTKWGNPYSLAKYREKLAMLNYRLHLLRMIAAGSLDLKQLKGKDLACWCPPDKLCHADILIELANNPAP